MPGGGVSIRAVRAIVPAVLLPSVALGAAWLAGCGTPQFPKTPVCVNPDCNAFHSQEDHEFADSAGYIKAFTGDLLSVSVAPPNCYGMVQFEEGGRMMADFTDCEVGELSVGQPVVMAMRKRYEDKDRGFHGYFWKAIPQKTQG